MIIRLQNTKHVTKKSNIKYNSISTSKIFTYIYYVKIKILDLL
jgi:hypothetical protein